MFFKNYDPGTIAVTFKGIPMLGVMDGTFVTVERNEDAFSVAVGAAGDVARVRNRDKTGMVTVTLQQGSPINDLLTAQALLDEVSGLGFGPLMVKDLRGTTLVLAPIAWIKKMPTVEFGDELSGREWVFECASLEIKAGGAIT